MGNYAGVHSRPPRQCAAGDSAVAARYRRSSVERTPIALVKNLTISAEQQKICLWKQTLGSNHSIIPEAG